MCQKRILFILLLTMTFLPRLHADDTWTSTWVEPITTSPSDLVGQTITFLSSESQPMVPFKDDALTISPATSALVFYEGLATTSEHVLSFVVEKANDNQEGHFYLYCLEKNSYIRIGVYDETPSPRWYLKGGISAEYSDYWYINDGIWCYHTALSTGYYLLYDKKHEYFYFSSTNNIRSNYTLVVKQSTTYQRPITNQWGTLCLPYAIDMSQVSDAAFYGIMGKETTENGTNLILEELTTVAAGQPCFVYTPAGINTLTIPLISDIVTTPTTNNNGLIGTFQEISQEASTLNGKYILSSNALNLCKNNCGLRAYRAYVDMSKMPTLTGEQVSSAPVRLPLASAYTTPTDNNLPNTVHSTKPTRYLHNGHIVLSNGQQRFTILGQPL